MEMEYVLVFITGGGERSIEQAMVLEKVAEFDAVEQKRILQAAGQMGVDGAAIVGQIPLSAEHYALLAEMGEGRIYIG